MKLLLTSTGLSNPKITEAFFGLAAKEPKDIKVAFVPTASRIEEELKYVEESRRELINLSILADNIKNINLERNVDFEEIKDCSVMYVCGGNTFYLLNKIRETGFDEMMNQFIADNKVYVGVSAGSIIATPNINVAGVEPADPNDVGLIDLKGLNWVNFEVSPHVPEIVSYDNAEKYSQTTDNKIYAINNSSAVLFRDNNVSVVGSGTSRIYNSKT